MGEPGRFLDKNGRPTAFEYGSEGHAQRACYIALRKKGWIVRPSLIAHTYFIAIRHDREESVSAKDFRELLNLACKADAAWAEKQRAKARAEAAAAAKEG